MIEAMDHPFPIAVLRVVDGDTLDVEVDLGFRVLHRVRVRLEDVDTPETYGVKKDSDEFRAGVKARNFVVDWINKWAGANLYLRTEKAGKYGRWIATITTGTGESLNDAIRASGHSKA